MRERENEKERRWKKDATTATGSLRGGKGGECCVEALADVMEENPPSPLLPFPFFFSPHTN